MDYHKTHWERPNNGLGTCHGHVWVRLSSSLGYNKTIADASKTASSLNETFMWRRCFFFAVPAFVACVLHHCFHYGMKRMILEVLETATPVNYFDCSLHSPSKNVIWNRKSLPKAMFKKMRSQAAITCIPTF